MASACLLHSIKAKIVKATSDAGYAVHLNPPVPPAHNADRLEVPSRPRRLFLLIFETPLLAAVGAQRNLTLQRLTIIHV